MDCYFRNENGKCKLDKQLRERMPYPCPNNVRCFFYINVPPERFLSEFVKIWRKGKVVKTVGSGGVNVNVIRRKAVK